MIIYAHLIYNHTYIDVSQHKHRNRMKHRVQSNIEKKKTS